MLNIPLKKTHDIPIELGEPHIFWLVVSTPLKNISQLGWLFPIYGKIKNGNQTTNQLSIDIAVENGYSYDLPIQHVDSSWLCWMIREYLQLICPVCISWAHHGIWCLGYLTTLLPYDPWGFPGALFFPYDHRNGGQCCRQWLSSRSWRSDQVRSH